MKEEKIPVNTSETTFNYDLEQMKRAVEAPVYRVPLGLNRDELKEWMKSNKTPPCYAEPVEPYLDWLHRRLPKLIADKRHTTMETFGCYLKEKDKTQLGEG